MSFFALRIRCEECDLEFLAGGCAQSDLPVWHRCVVECSHCGAETRAERGVPVDLRDMNDSLLHEEPRLRAAASRMQVLVS
jgi:hypothetical protein